MLLVDFTKQEERDALIEVTQVVQPPDTEGPALEQKFPFPFSFAAATLTASPLAVSLEELF